MQWFTNHQHNFLKWVQMIHRTYSAFRNVYFLIFTFVNKFPDIDLKGSRNVQFCMKFVVTSQWPLHPLIVCWLHFSLLSCKDHNVHIYGRLFLLFETVISLFSSINKNIWTSKLLQNLLLRHAKWTTILVFVYRIYCKVSLYITYL